MNTKKSGGNFRTGGETIIARACRTVPGFAKTYQTFERTLTLRQRSKSAMQDYGRSIAKVVILFYYVCVFSSHLAEKKLYCLFCWESQLKPPGSLNQRLNSPGSECAANDSATIRKFALVAIPAT